MIYRTIFGIDNHARSTTIAVLDTKGFEVEKRTFPGNDYKKMKAYMDKFPKPAWGVFEDGVCGYVPARELTDEAREIIVTPIAPSKMPVSDNTRNKKNDKNDAVSLARNAMCGNLTIVWVPDEETEGLRDISHTLEDLKDQRKAAYQRVSALLMRHGVVWNRRTKGGNLKKQWTKEYWTWVRGIKLSDPSSQKALEAALRAAESAREQYDEAERAAKELVRQSSKKNLVYALTCLKCVQFVTALAFVAEVGDFGRFPSGRKVTSYFGLVPREESSGGTQKLGRITKSGSPMVRKLLTECSWAATRCGAGFKLCPEGTDPRIVERSRTLSKRLADKRRANLERGMAPCKANAATAAELARFMLFLGKEQQEIDENALLDAAAEAAALAESESVA